MDWGTFVVVFTLVFHANGFSKYGRTCKDIGCLRNEVCVLAEDACTFGSSGNCGTYPTCKKTSRIGGSHSEPAQPAAPKPHTPPRGFNSPPSYPPPTTPFVTSFGGGSSFGGGTRYSPYGGGSPYGGSSPYAGSSRFGGSSPYGGSLQYGGSSSYGGSSPYGGSSSYGQGSNRGFGTGGGSTSGFGTSGGNSIDSILRSLQKYAGSVGGNSGTGSFSSRSIVENPNYSSHSANSRSFNLETYPSGYQSNYNQGRTYGHYNAGATTRPTYGWNIG